LVSLPRGGKGSSDCSSAKSKQQDVYVSCFARDFPTVYKAINDLKRKDYRQLAYLLQAHESKIMIDIICRKILDELPGTFIATIRDYSKITGRIE